MELQVEDDIADLVPMTLSQLMDGVTVTKMFQTLFGQMVVTHDVQVNHLQYDSRKVERGDLFVAIRGSGFDGHRFVVEAIAKGANVIMIEDDSAAPDSLFMHAGVAKIVVPSTRVALAQMSANFFDHPSSQLLMIGVTGTNGKTTTAQTIQSILAASGSTTGLIGTIEYKIGDEVLPATHTTPESLELNEMLARMVHRKCTAAVMEVSSHALHQHRVHGIHFHAAVFTNLTQDHLDYHGSMDEYFAAKEMLFESLDRDALAVVNIDDEWGRKILSNTAARKITYGTRIDADVCARDITLSMRGTNFAVVHQGESTPVHSPLIGRFNVSNLLAAFATSIVCNISKTVIQRAIREMKPVRGRFEQIVAPHGWTAVIDYAHTPDALLKAVSAIRDISGVTSGGKIITVFGCGGNRDRGKRPQMARIATEYSDVTIITSDNPRHENPETIIDEVMTGIQPGARVIRQPDREKAIVAALELASRNDIILIAGKGHEDYQVIGDEKIHFNDREVVETFLRTHA